MDISGEGGTRSVFLGLPLLCRSSPFCLAGRDEVASGDVEIRFPVATCGDPVCSSVVVSADMHMQHPCLPRRVPLPKYLIDERVQTPAPK